MKALLDALGNPEADFRAIHIAGTNGKGSTAVMIASILEEAGYSVGLYTSPHLETECERVQIWDGTHRMIEQDKLDALHAPIGLDIGGEDLREIAVSIVAEMMAVKYGRDGGFTRDKKRGEMFPDAE